MAKESGLGANAYIAGVHLSGDVRDLQTNGPRPTHDVPGVDVSAFERIHLTRDGSMSFNVYFNPETAADDPGVTEDRAHTILSQLPTADQLVTYAHRPVLGAPVASVVGKQVGYDWTRDANGAISGIAVQALGNRHGREWGRMLTAGVAQLTSGAPNGSGLDFGAATGTTAFGLQAYLHVMAFVGTDVTIAVQHSDDNGGTDPYADVPNGVFVQVTSAPGSQRLQTDRDEPVKRWLRVAATTTGGFTSVDVAVMVVKNLREVLF